MIKTLLLFLLLPFFGFAQVDLVKWDNPTSFASHVLVSNITSSDMTGTNLSMLNYVGFTGTSWPVGNFISSSSYIQISIKANTGYKIDLSTLKYAYNPYDGTQGCRKYQVRYSKDAAFPSDGTLLLDNQSPSTSAKTNVSLPFPTGVYVLPGETMYIRFYGYDRGNTGWDGARWGLLSSHTDVNDGSYSVPTINGAVTAYNPVLKTFDDTATSIKNNFTFINVLANDSQSTNPITSVTVATQPTNSGGTAVVNTADKTIKFNPTAGFTGATSFTYTIGDGTNTSTATVNITVNEPTTNDLVKWNGPGTDAPTIIASTSAVAAGNVTSGPNSTLTVLANEGFKGTGWPTTFVKDDNKYLQVTVSAKTGYKLKLNSFNFTYNEDANMYVKRYQVRYSKDNFVTSSLLLDEATVAGKVNKSISLSNLIVTAGETLTLRIYGYKLTVNSDSNSPIFLANSNTIQTGNTTPTITGTVLQYDPNEINANDDNVTTKKNIPLTINTLNNDTAGTSAITSIIIANQPASGQGTVLVNPDKSVTFTPGTNFTGQTFFNYTISNSTKSSTGTVFVTVDEINPSLIIWNGASQQPVAALSDNNITAANITAPGMTFGTNYSNFRINSSPNTIDYTKYIQVSASPKTGYKLELTQFKFTYKSPSANNQGPKKYEVHFSTDPAFPSNGTTLTAQTTAVLDAETAVSVNFPPGVVITQNQTIYIRIYVYGNDTGYSDYYLIHDNGGDLGPAIMGIVSDTNTLTANYDTITTPANQAVLVPVLNNDTIGSTPLQNITIATQSLNGTAIVNGVNDITFTPTTGFTGVTSFVYTLFNGSTYSSAIVYVTVTAPPCVATPTPGANYWKGYVYTYTGTVPAMTTYVGSIAEKAIFDRDVDNGVITGDATVEANNFCGPVPSDKFYVRYLMQVNTTTAGAYNFTIGGDDGVRLYVDGNLVTLNSANSWTDHSYTTYAAQVNLTAASHTFMLEYYDNDRAARVSFSYGLTKGDSTVYGDNKWNVYGYTLADITTPAASYAGTYVETSVNINTQTYWDKTKSPSTYSGWQGAPIGKDQFALVYKRQGFPCGQYKIQLVNCDDVAEIYIDGVKIFTQNGYTNTAAIINGGQLYPLNKNSKVDVRFREDGGDANLSINFIDTPTVYNGTGTLTANTTSISITSDTTLQADLNVCSCTVGPGVTLTVPTDKTLTVEESITIGANGKLLIKDGGSLLQNNTAVGAYQGASNSFEVQRNTTPVRRYDYTHWSSPVFSSSFTLHDLSPNTLADKYYKYDQTAGWVLNYNGTFTMTPGMGYIVRAPQYFDINTPAVYPASFVGVPNNGDIKVTPVLDSKWILLGNPYPSAMSAQSFITQNPSVGSLYFWTHNSPPSTAVAGDAKYNYTSNDYAVFNLTGSVNAKGATTSGNQDAPSGYIASGVAFFIKPSTSADILYTNDMRKPGNNKQFFKNSETNELEQNRVWLNFTNAEGVFKQVLVGYIEGATNTWDLNYDAGTISGNTYVDFYSINDTENLTVQGRALPFDNTDLVPLGYKTTIAGDFTISIDHADGFFNNQKVYLEDKTTNTVHDLTASDYTFTSAIGNFNDRFTLRYTNKTLGTGDFENIDKSVLVSVKDKVIKVNSTQESIKEVTIYDISGKLVYNKKKVGTTELQIMNLQSSNQVLVIKVTLENDYITSKKIIFN